MITHDHGTINLNSINKLLQMKKTNCLLILLSVLLILPCAMFAQSKSSKKKGKNEEAVPQLVFTNNVDTVSYIIGANIAQSIKSNDIVINYDKLSKGLQDGLNGTDTVFKPEQIQQIMTVWNQQMMKAKQEKNQQEAVANKKKGAEFPCRKQEERRSH